MKIKAIILLLVALTLTACGGTTPTYEKNSTNPFINLDTKDPKIIQIAEFAASDIFDDYLADVVTAKKEIVEGTNYHLTILLRNRSVYDVVVYENLQGNLKLSNSKKLN